MNEIWYVLMILFPLLWLIFVLSMDNHYLRQRVKRLRIRFEYLREGNDLMKKHGFDPAECANSHLAGDCPLCGSD